MYDRIYSEEKEEDILAVLRNPHPTHSERLWVVGFLKYCGYSESDVLDIILKHHNWNVDSKGNRRLLSRSITKYQIKSVFRSSVPHFRRSENQHPRQRNKKRCRVSSCEELTPLERRRILRAKVDAFDRLLRENGVLIYESH